MMARTMRKMQVPAYAPVEEGVQAEEKRGVLWSLWKTMLIMVEEDMSELDMECEWLMSMVFSVVSVFCPTERCDVVASKRQGK